MKLPPNNQWTQPNNSDRTGSVFASMNVNFDEQGYVKLSPRTVTLIDEDENADFGIPLGIGRYTSGTYLLATSSNANFDGSISTTALTITENSGTSEPTLTSNSHAIFWRNLWHASTATAVLSRVPSDGATATWTSRITGLTSGVRHYLMSFVNRNTICVTNGNVVKQYDTSYASTTDLTVLADYEVIGGAYNNAKLGLITRLGSSTEGQNKEAMFFVWDGGTTEATSGVGVGADACISVCAYKGSWAVLTRTGELLYWNGGGFTRLGALPFYFTDKMIGDILNNITLGENMVADGDNIFINVPSELNGFGRNSERTIENFRGGVWCYDPKVGLYHRYAPSRSAAVIKLVADADVNTTTNTLTTSATVPATGSIARFTSSQNGIGGLTVGQDYYVIKQSSTSFQLAETKDLALAGVAIDLTTAGVGGSNYFWIFTITDYAQSFYSLAGAVALTNESNLVFRDILFGGDYTDTALADKEGLCAAVPFLENRGYIVTPKIFTESVKGSLPKATVKFRRLKNDDKVIVKIQTEEAEGLPITAPNITTGDEAVWTSDNEFYTSTDLSDAKTYLDAGNALEMEITGGSGAGTLVNVTSISDASSGVYAVVLDEPVIGTSAGNKSYFIINNWKFLAEVSATDTENDLGYLELSISEPNAKWYKLKIELRGYETTIEEIEI